MPIKFRCIPRSRPNSLRQFDVVSERLRSNTPNYSIQIKTNFKFYFDFFDGTKWTRNDGIMKITTT